MLTATKALTITSFGLLLCSCVSAQAQTQSTGQNNKPTTSKQRSASATGNAQQRTINWDAASSDAISSATSQKVVVLNARMRPASTEPVELVVPVLLPVSNQAVQLDSGQSIEFAEPRLLQTNNGYTAVLKGSARDLVIDASSKSVSTSAATRQVPASNFDGDYQQTEGGGGELTIGRYGAFYSIQLVCNNPEKNDCVNEDMLRSIVDGLVLTQPLYRKP